MPSDEIQFALLGEPLAVDLVNTIVNTREGQRDLLADPPRLDAWFEREADRLDLGGGPPTFEEIAALRAAISSVLRAHVARRRPDPQAIDAVNAAAARAPIAPQLAWDDEPLAEVHETANGAERVLGAIARSAIELLAGEDGERLHKCASDRCSLLFLATGRRRWCTAACGNRNRVLRHYQRSRAEAEG